MSEKVSRRSFLARAVGLNMRKIHMYTQLGASSNMSKTRMISLEDKLEILKINIEETQKYELLTTNQYLKHIELVVDILEDLSKETIQEKRQ